MSPYYKYSSPIGDILFETSETALIRLTFEDCIKPLEKLLIADASSNTSPVVEQTFRWLELYFNGKRPDFIPPLKCHASDFQKKVYEIARKIPYGLTSSYGSIAKSIAKADNRSYMSAQAVGTALRNNPILLIIPCHRIVAADGSLSGFAAGLERKRWLLDYECENLSILHP